MSRIISRVLACGAAVIGLLLAAPAAEAEPGFDQNAVIFVHGFSGSGAQFESQKMRFTSNGYPQSHIRVLEYDSTFGTESRQMVHARLDELVAELEQQTGREKVDILGHSLGTSVMQDYLSSPERAANVAHSVNIDGREADAPPGDVPTLAIWAGRGDPDRRIEGAKNVYLPNQTHVQSATSEEAFAAFYEFFTGAPPATSAIVRESGQIEIEGRAVVFPQNRGLTATAVEVWEIDSATGQRIGSTPLASAPTDRDGAWGPVEVQAGEHYELAVIRPGVTTLHYYYEPFVRSDRLLRLLYADAIEAAVQRSENHVSGLVLRYKELWGDQGAESDVLAFNGLNACNEATCPIESDVNAVFAYDRGLDGQSDLSSPDPVFSSLPFITGVDVFMPAARPPTGTVSVSLTSRGVGPARTVNFPNFPSTTDGFVVQFNDFERVVDGASGAEGPCSNRIDGTGERDKLNGTKGSDRIIGKRGNDRLVGRGGDDCLLGKGGRDEVRGNGGGDEIRAGGGRDEVEGNGGRDVIRPGRGKDGVRAGGGRDVVRAARGGRDRIDCGPGKDKAFVNERKDRTTRCETVKAR